MKTIKYFLILFLLTLYTYPVFGLDIIVDKEDEEFKKDLYLGDTEFFKKYVSAFKSANTDFLHKSFIATDDPEIKVYVLRAAAAKDINDSNVVELFKLAIRDGIWNFKHYDPMAISHSWKVRAAAAYILEKNAPKIQDKNKTSYAKKLLLAVDDDPEERVRGMSVLALGKLFANKKADDKDKSLIVITLIGYLGKDNPGTAQFFYWSIVKSLGYLKDERGFYPLLQARRNKFNKKVTLEISRSLNSIIKGGPSVTNTK